MSIEKKTLKIDQIDWLKDHIELYTSNIKERILVKFYKNEKNTAESIYSFIKKKRKEKQELYLLRVLPFIYQDKKINRLKEKNKIKFSGEYKIRDFIVGEKYISFCILHKIRNLAEFKEVEVELTKINSYFIYSSKEEINDFYEDINSLIFHSTNQTFNMVNTIKLLLLLRRGQSLIKRSPKDERIVYFFHTLP